MMSPMPELETLRQRLCQLGDAIRDAVIAGRARQSIEQLSAVSHESAADTIYAIDKLSEDAILAWFRDHWPVDEPVELVFEGIDETAPPCFPAGIDALDTRWKIILDPIDGTRGLMVDKRPAWVLVGLAPQLGPATSLSDICVAAMTEIPLTKQWRADQVSAIKGRGITAESVNVLDGSRAPLELRPSGATDFRHGFASMAKFFPEGRTLISQIEEQVWDELVGLGATSSPTIFDDQYISTGGAFYELLAGHDRFVGDIRPMIHAVLDLDSTLVCHPYDVAAALVLIEAGVIYESPFGGFPDAPLDTTSPVAWFAFANETLAAKLRPVLHDVLASSLG
jgi:fructose-1,6-bisphosphatase/inositol monophosphatase family enzyme